MLVHRARQGFVEQRTATFNRIRGLLAKLGTVLPLKAAVVRREAMASLEDLPGWANTVIGYLLNEIARLDERIAQYDPHTRHISGVARQGLVAAPYKSSVNTGDRLREQQISSLSFFTFSSSESSMSPWAGVPSITAVSHMPQEPCMQP